MVMWTRKMATVAAEEGGQEGGSSQDTCSHVNLSVPTGWENAPGS